MRWHLALILSLSWPASLLGQAPQEKLTIKANGVWSVAFTPDGKMLAVGEGNGSVKLYDAATGKLVRQFEGHTSTVTSISFSTDGRTMASGSLDFKVRVWDVATGKLRLTLTGHTHQVYTVALTGDGKRLASGGFDQTLRLWDAENGRELLVVKGGQNFVHGVAFTPDGSQVFAGDGAGNLKCFETATGKERLALKSERVYSQCCRVAERPARCQRRRRSYSALVGSGDRPGTVHLEGTQGGGVRRGVFRQQRYPRFREL